MGNSNLLFESIFKKKLSDAGIQEFLTQITNEHPYFSPAQFFLLLQAEKGTVIYEQQAAKTSIVFNNPYWLQFQLQEKQPASVEEINDLDSIAVNDTSFISQGSLLNQITESDKTLDNNEIASIFHQGTEEVYEETDQIVVEEEVPAIRQENLMDIIAENETAPSFQESVFTEPEVNTEAANPKFFPHPSAWENTVSDLENDNAAKIEKSGIEPLSDEEIILPIPINEEEISLAIENGEVINENRGGNVSEMDVETIDSLHSGHFNNEDSPLVNETEAEDDPAEPEIAPLNFKLNIDTSNTTEDTIAFEPLHTSDYFASLGIRLSGEIKPSDKLGKQLKSFTEWLKTMKKIGSDQLPQQSEQADTSIQKLAEQSNKEAGVVTEAMAEVLLQQGKARKAMEVYEKLSLLNPSKSTYFAAKIDQLKEH